MYTQWEWKFLKVEFSMKVNHVEKEQEKIIKIQIKEICRYIENEGGVI